MMRPKTRFEGRRKEVVEPDAVQAGVENRRREIGSGEA